MNKNHIGSNFDNFLEEEGIFVEVLAIKRVIAFQNLKWIYCSRCFAGAANNIGEHHQLSCPADHGNCET